MEKTLGDLDSSPSKAEVTCCTIRVLAILDPVARQD
jgi:hypothetical protein